MVLKIFFFDTYAFFEILHGNPNYDQYTNETVVVTTRLNLMELHYGILLERGKEEAEKWYQEYLPSVVEVGDEVIKLANEFRASMKEYKLSYVDCIGYTIARLRGIPFLTGDRQFQYLPGVEFVK